MMDAWMFGFKRMYTGDYFYDDGNDDNNSSNDDGDTVNASTVLYTVRLFKITLKRISSYQTIGQKARFDIVHTHIPPPPHTSFTTIFL